MPRSGEGREAHSLVEDGRISWTCAKCMPLRTISTVKTQLSLNGKSKVVQRRLYFQPQNVHSHFGQPDLFLFASLLLSKSYTNCYKNLNIKLSSANTTRQLLLPRTHVVMSTKVSTILEKHVCNFREPILQCQTKWS